MMVCQIFRCTYAYLELLPIAYVVDPNPQRELSTEVKMV